MKTARKEVPAAILTIRDAASMKPKEKMAVAKWLRKQADGLMLEGCDYAKRFTARYFK